MLILILGPLPLGSVLTRERTALAIAAFSALAFAFAGRRSFTAPAAPALAIAGVGMIGILQSLRWPGALVRTLAPGLAETWTTTGAWLGCETGLLPLSVAPAVSRSIGLHWLAVAACLSVAWHLSDDRLGRRLLALALLVAAIFEVAYGADNWLGQNNTIWGMEVPGDQSRFRGTFVNPDHFAFYMLMPTAAALAALWWSLRRALRGGALERRLLQTALPGLAFSTFFVVLAFSGSRGGLISALLMIAVQGVLLVAHYRKWQVVLATVAAFGLAVGGLVVFGLQHGLGRWLETSIYELAWNVRLTTYRTSWELWSQHPWTGTGLGTFRQAFPQAQPPELTGTWFHAHSDVLELLVTTGVLGLPLMALALVVTYRRLWRVFQKGRRSEDRAAGLAGLGAVTGTLLHSLVDFGLTIPANAFTLAIVCGLACGARTTALTGSPAPR